MSDPLVSRLVGPALALALALLAPVAEAQQGDVVEARLRFQQGSELYGRGEYQAAFEQFAASYRAVPHPAVLYNMAQCQIQLGKPAEAIRLLERLVAQGADPAITEEARRTIERLRLQRGP